MTQAGAKPAQTSKSKAKKMIGSKMTKSKRAQRQTPKLHIQPNPNPSKGAGANLPPGKVANPGPYKQNVVKVNFDHEFIQKMRGM